MIQRSNFAAYRNSFKMSYQLKFLLVFVLSVSIFVLDYEETLAQGSVYSVKTGLTAGTQRWNNYNRRPLMKYHIAGAIETHSPENLSSLFVQLGYHLKGSALRRSSFSSPVTGNIIPGGTDEFKFHNVSLVLGGKQKMEVFTESRLYYLVGVRGDFNVKAEFDRGIYDNFSDHINKFTFGVTVGGGLEVPLSTHTGIFFELSVSPDFSNQIYIPPHRSFWDPNRMNPEQKVINIAVELSVGMRFLHEVIYVQ